LTGSKNLATATETKTVAGEQTTQQTSKGQIIDFMWRLKRDGVADRTILNYTKMLKRLIKRGADLQKPDSIKDAIAMQDHWKDSTKALAVAAYQKYAKEYGLKWTMPRYRFDRKLPFVPLESEVDALISACGRKTATMLQLLKETAARVGEAMRLTWTDVDLEHNTVTVNNPEKHGKPRMCKISSKLAAMLNSLPKRNDRVFSGSSLNSLEQCFRRQRTAAASKLQNPRLKMITFHTLRHFKATMEYHKTKDILHVMQMLGHRNIQNTLIYTQLVNFEASDYHSATAASAEEAKELVEGGFEYVCTTPENVMLFRKRR
jgi:integrase